MDTTLSSIGCPLCKKPSNNLLTEKLRRGEGKVFFCESCKHGFLDLKPKIDMKKYYSEEYRKEYSNRADVSSTNAQEIFDVYNQYQDSRLEIIRPALNKNKSLLEVGISSGQFVDHIKNEVNIINGIELDKDCCDYVNNIIGIETDYNYLPESKFKENKYDLVCSFQVMEHVPDPTSFLHELINATESNGKIFIEVPNLHDPLLNVWNNDAYKDFYYHSAHLHYFTEESLLKVALEAGLKPDMVEFEYTQDYNLLNHLNWITNNAPQSDCHVGLSKIDIKFDGNSISEWLDRELVSLNKNYIDRLKEIRSTSNIMMIITIE